MSTTKDSQSQSHAHSHAHAHGDHANASTAPIGGGGGDSGVTVSDDTNLRDIALWTKGGGGKHAEKGNLDQRLDKANGLLDHAHDKDDREDVVLTKLKRASLLCLTFLLVEVVGGYLAGSLAVLSDAAHLCADLASFAVAIGASYLAKMPKTASYTYGLKRVESLAAMLSMLSLAFISAALGVEALRRIYTIVAVDDPDNPVQVEGTLMSGIAFIGVLVNVALAVVLGEHHVHLPSDDGCGHGHDHGQDHGHEQEKQAATTTNRRRREASSHDQSHEHAHGHDHGATESTPLVSTGACDDDHRGHEHDHGHGSSVPEQSVTTSGDDHGHGDEIRGRRKDASHNDPQDHDDESGGPIPFLPKNINLRAAYLHVLGDLAQSVAVLIAGLVIWIKPHWTIVDPLCTLLFCALVGYSTIGVLRTSVAVLLQEVPPSVSWKDVFDAIESIDGVSDVHDLHIWSISHGIPALSVHCRAENPQHALEKIYACCRDFGIVHATIQVQSGSEGDTDAECVTCTDRMCRLCQFADERNDETTGVVVGPQDGALV